ncbi:uncharacterized protein B0I36DRAFT_349286 [Microdochium trichocladiopsis]|uniref:Uncharacterized protein n=1 Tax=Microdochium trichocladiopsis TaxID=1682393 RepID=A0A9P9BQR1_9PEZI|nr:uncharacterized protein B0I36DRAFT_349286 [Microdochium trichocladiopsis]KAH7031172.1 hypothetical protein B0I36DRAFT_349286 [Microdochium trichocladiopsis]
MLVKGQLTQDRIPCNNIQVKLRRAVFTTSCRSFFGFVNINLIHQSESYSSSSSSSPKSSGSSCERSSVSLQSSTERWTFRGELHTLLELLVLGWRLRMQAGGEYRPRFSGALSAVEGHIFEYVILRHDDLVVAVLVLMKVLDAELNGWHQDLHTRSLAAAPFSGIRRRLWLIGRVDTRVGSGWPSATVDEERLAACTLSPAIGKEAAGRLAPSRYHA